MSHRVTPNVLLAQLRMAQAKAERFGYAIDYECARSVGERLFRGSNMPGADKLTIIHIAWRRFVQVDRRYLS